jgi:uncharacterized protein YggU (UPF0235/DUF167 family)
MYIHVKVVAGAKAEKVEAIDETHLAVWVREPAERNLANNRIIELVRERFPAAGKIRIVSGHHSPSKLLSVELPDDA